MEILDRGDIDVARMRGSWAGAMGQPQFMPSSYLKWAEDFDGDGRRDIWSTPPDVFASIANYLQAHGWKTGQTWGREVTISREAARRLIANDVERRNGSCVARRDMTVGAADGPLAGTGRPPHQRGRAAQDRVHRLARLRHDRHFLVYDNYDALLEYNCAHSYAISVALLSGSQST